MHAEVKNIMSPDIDFKSYYPKDEYSFMFLIQITIGMKDEEGGDSFSIEVCTPNWLLENYNLNDVIFGRHKLIVFEYNIDKILDQILNYCKSCEGTTWQEIAGKISRIALWEFEDYKQLD